MSGIRSTFDHVVRTELAELPLPGRGDTWARFERALEVGCPDLSLGRLFEGHADALAILAEAGIDRPFPGATYGVWAARSPRSGTTARLESDGWHLAGQKPFCSGSGLLERALVTADTVDGYRLFDIDVARQVVSPIRIPGRRWVWRIPRARHSDSVDRRSQPSRRGRSRLLPFRPGFWLGRSGSRRAGMGGQPAWWSTSGARSALSVLISWWSTSVTPSPMWMPCGASWKRHRRKSTADPNDQRGRAKPGRTWSGMPCTMAPSGSWNTSRPPEALDRSATIVGRGSAPLTSMCISPSTTGLRTPSRLGRAALAGRAWN